MTTSQQSASVLVSTTVAALVFVGVLWALAHLGQAINTGLALLR